MDKQNKRVWKAVPLQNTFPGVVFLYTLVYNGIQKRWDEKYEIRR